MRVIHVIKATGIAGAERHLIDLLPGLRARGCDARLLVLVEPRRPVPEFLEAVRAPAETLTIHGDLDATLVARLCRAFRRQQPDLVHTHLVHADLYGACAARLARVPAVISTRHDDNAFRRRRLWRAVHRWLWARTNGGIAVSRSLGAFCREIEGARVPIQVIPHGVPELAREPSAPARAELGLAADATVVAIVCRLIPQKGVADALAAFAAAAPAFPSATLLIAGDGAQRAQLERAAGPRVRFLGWQPDSGRILAASDLLLVPSRLEGFGLIVLEAMARGLPVLATRAGALPEIVADGETGLLVEVRDAAAMAAALARLLGDAPLRARLGAAGRDRARREFSLAAMIDRTLEFYEETMSRRSRPRSSRA